MAYVIDLLLLLVFFNGLYCNTTVVKQIQLRCTHENLKL